MVQIIIDEEKCNGCGDCLFICPVDAYEVKKGKATWKDGESCCGLTCKQCSFFCPMKAITITEV